MNVFASTNFRGGLKQLPLVGKGKVTATKLDFMWSVRPSMKPRVDKEIRLISLFDNRQNPEKLKFKL
jgi:hypothetical protein